MSGKKKSPALVVVDDGSDVDVFELVKDKPLFFLRHKINLDRGAALQTGIEFALSQQALFIISFDADCSTT